MAMMPTTFRFSFKPRDCRHRPQHRHPAAFVEDHLLHLVRRLDGNAAGVEGDRLADQRDRRLARRPALDAAARSAAAAACCPCPTASRPPNPPRSQLSSRPARSPSASRASRCAGTPRPASRDKANCPADCRSPRARFVAAPAISPRRAALRAFAQVALLHDQPHARRWPRPSAFLKSCERILAQHRSFGRRAPSTARMTAGPGLRPGRPAFCKRPHRRSRRGAERLLGHFAAIPQAHAEQPVVVQQQRAVRLPRTIPPRGQAEGMSVRSALVKNLTSVSPRPASARESAFSFTIGSPARSGCPPRPAVYRGPRRSAACRG